MCVIFYFFIYFSLVRIDTTQRNKATPGKLICTRCSMLSKLPLEIQVRLLSIAPSSSLKLVNSHYYMLYNDMYFQKIISTFGEDSVKVICKVLHWMKTYIKTLDAVRFVGRNLIASRLNLKDTEYDYNTDDDFIALLKSDSNPLNSIYIKDSWKYIYSVMKNKRLFAEYSDYKIDEPVNYVYNHFVEINRTYLLSYIKTLWLSPGDYNINIGLVVKHGSGLGTTKFEVKFKDEQGKEIVQSFYPPTNINEILPKGQFCFLKIGEFQVPEKEGKAENQSNKLHRITLIMEEIGLYLKSGFRIFFIDISQPSLLFNDYDLLYYAVNETDYKFFINIPLKNLYRALNYVQDNPRGYGHGNPHDIDDQYDRSYLLDIPTSSLETFEEGSILSKEELDARLKAYGEFYYNNKFKKRLFKFRTIYQKRQFVNRFGDFELDWHEFNEDHEAKYGEDENSGQTRSCFYDMYGIKWKIPLLGEL